MVKKMALGRGLGALIEDAETPQQRAEQKEVKHTNTDLIKEIDINAIEANPYQPRTTFDQQALEELAESIKTLGIIQPLTLRSVDGKYQLISGERRLRAAKMAGLTTVPAFIRVANDQGLLEMALVENIQREDLDAIEVAISYQRLIDECNLSHDNLSERVGKKRATVTNYIRLLKLPAEIQLGIKERKLSMGHARALVSLDDKDTQIELYHKIVDEDLSVRRVEEITKNIAESPKEKPEQKPETVNITENPNTEEIQRKLQEVFGWGLEVKAGKQGSGKIIISYRSQGELDEIMERFNHITL